MSIEKILQNVLNQMGMTEFILNAIGTFPIGFLFPCLSFLASAILSFMLASSWGVCSLSAPILLQVGAGMNVSPLLIMAVFMSGCALGNHICLYGDTTILTAKATGLNTISVIKIQMPYIAIGAAVSCAGFIILGLLL
ncbi:MAG: Na+/H+ antiporter NhaC family protein [Bilifractor sp.]|jgi:Na+/H+ antiporter NhaC